MLGAWGVPWGAWHSLIWVLPQSSSVSTWFLFSLFFPTFNEEFSLGPGVALHRGCQSVHEWQDSVLVLPVTTAAWKAMGPVPCLLTGSAPQLPAFVSRVAFSSAS